MSSSSSYSSSSSSLVLQLLPSPRALVERKAARSVVFQSPFRRLRGPSSIQRRRRHSSIHSSIHPSIYRSPSFARIPAPGPDRFWFGSGGGWLVGCLPHLARHFPRTAIAICIDIPDSRANERINRPGNGGIKPPVRRQTVRERRRLTTTKRWFPAVVVCGNATRCASDESRSPPMNPPQKKTRGFRIGFSDSPANSAVCGSGRKFPTDKLSYQKDRLRWLF